MKYSILILIINIYFANSFLFKSETDWNDLKVTWGMNPFDSNSFVSLPRTESEAIIKGWVKDKDCSQANGNCYILHGDRAAILIFEVRGIIAGIASAIPKQLPFNFPLTKVQRLLIDEGDYYTINAYFIDPASVCSPHKVNGQITGDRLVIKGKDQEIKVELNEANLSNFWTRGKCFYTMGTHYWASLSGPLNENTDADDFVPIFLLYNKGKLNGFGWAFNADLPSPRYEHPYGVVDQFFYTFPKFFLDPNKTRGFSTLHIFLDSTPQLNFC